MEEKKRRLSPSRVVSNLARGTFTDLEYFEL